MSAFHDHINLPGSERSPLPGAKSVGKPEPDQEIEVTLVLRSRQQLPEGQALTAHSQSQNLSREEALKQLEHTFGPSQQDLDKLKAFAAHYHLSIEQILRANSSIKLKGTVANMEAAFGVNLETYQYNDTQYRGRSGSVQVPKELEEIVLAVLGLDDRPQTTPKFKRLEPAQPHAGTQPVKYSPLDLAKLYNFPNGYDGTGQCIAIIELGGGYKTADLRAYFKKYKLKQPQVVAVGIDGSSNQPTGQPNGPDGEVLLDIEVAGAVVPGARLAVYFAPNTTNGFLDAINTAIHDTTNKPNIISISWGGPESSWTKQALQAYDQSFQLAGAVGISVFCAAGDSGSADGVKDGKPHVDFPASSTYVTGCGGTKLLATNGQITSEVVWNEDPINSATGGGVSNFFPVPGWQQKVGVPGVHGSTHKGRGVPDVAADADPQTGYDVIVNGQDATFGGTSAVAPLWAGLTARLNQALGKPVGYLNPVLYSKLVNTPAFHDITQGNNGDYQAKAGWDPCTGLGSPDGTELLNRLK